MIDLTTGKIGCLYERKLICLAYTHILELDVIPEYLRNNVDKILSIVVSQLDTTSKKEKQKQKNNEKKNFKNDNFGSDDDYGDELDSDYDSEESGEEEAEA